MDKNTLSELACTYAALILQDEGLEITSQQMNKLIEASGNKVDGFWPNIFAKSLKGRNVNDLLCAGQAAAPAAPVQAVAVAKVEAKIQEVKKEEPKEEEEDYGNMDMFGDF